MKEMEQDEADERKGVPRAFFTQFSDNKILSTKWWPHWKSYQTCNTKSRYLNISRLQKKIV